LNSRALKINFFNMWKFYKNMHDFPPSKICLKVALL
jgi:hypothetical protein